MGSPLSSWGQAPTSTEPHNVMFGSNQWGPTGLPNFSGTGAQASSGLPTTVPTFPSPGQQSPGLDQISGVGDPSRYLTQSAPGGKNELGANTFTAPTFDPQSTSQYYTMLMQMMSGQMQPGGIQNQLLSFLSGGPSSIPGSSELAGMAKTGDPISALPEWQQMIAAQQQNIQQNQANLKEQFGFAGDLKSSPFGTAMSNYMQQTTLDQNSLLGQLQTQALESAQGRKLAADTSLQGEAGNMSQFLDQLFQTGSTASPGIYNASKGTGIGGLLGGIGSLLGGGASLGSAASDAGGLAALFAL